MQNISRLSFIFSYHPSIWYHIIDIKGTVFLSSILIGIRSHNRHQNSLWPLQQKPNSSSWNFWNSTIRRIYCCKISSLQLKKKFYLQRWLPNRFTVNGYQYSPTAHEVFEYRYPAIFCLYTFFLTTPLNSIVSMNQSSPTQTNSNTLVTIYSRYLSGYFYSLGAIQFTPPQSRYFIINPPIPASHLYWWFESPHQKWRKLDHSILKSMRLLLLLLSSNVTVIMFPL